MAMLELPYNDGEAIDEEEGPRISGVLLLQDLSPPAALFGTLPQAAKQVWSQRLCGGPSRGQYGAS